MRLIFWVVLLCVVRVQSSCPQTWEGLTGNVSTPSSSSFMLDILDANQGASSKSITIIINEHLLGFALAVPCAVVFCNSSTDVVNAVTFAAKNNIQRQLQ